MKKLAVLLVLLVIGFIVYAQEEAKKPEGGTTLTQYGILGTIVVALAGYIMRQDYLHRKEREDLKAERKEWQAIIERQFEAQAKQVEDTNKERREHTGILMGLKALLEQKNRTR